MRVFLSLFGLSLFSLFLFAACATIGSSATDLAKSLNIIEHTELATIPKEAPEDYRSGIQYLEAERYTEALDEFDHFIRTYPTSPWTQAATLNSGRALEGLSRWSEAAARDHDVIEATAAGKAPKLQAMALYRLSFCLEALSDDTATVAALTDLLARQAYLPREVARAELPARLAAAYARVGNFDRAVEFYNQAERGIAQLRAESAREELASGSLEKSGKSGKMTKGMQAKVPEWLPRTLYFMGNMSFRAVTFDDFEVAMRPLARGQIYLLQSAEFDFDPWSSRSAEALMKIYNGLWQVIATAPLANGEDALLAKRQQQRRQWELSALLLDAIVELQARALPKDAGGDGPEVRQVMAHVADIEKKLNALLFERPAGEGITSEAAARRNNRHPHVIVTSDDTLERKFLQSGRDVPSVTTESKAAPSETKPEKSVEKPGEKPGATDPNL